MQDRRHQEISPLRRRSLGKTFIGHNFSSESSSARKQNSDRTPFLTDWEAT
jgi:hypothetical protein